MVFRPVTLVVLLVLCATDVFAQRGLRPNRKSGGIAGRIEPEARRYSISGRVFWPDGLSPENVVIEYGGPDVPQGLWYVNDPGGLFTVEGASRGRYVLLARGETRTGPLIGIVSTDVANDSVHDVRLMLRQPGSIEGRVVVEGRAGADVLSLRLTATQTMLKLSPLYPVEQSALDAINRFTLSNLLGEYTLSASGLPPGWRVRRMTRGGAALPGSRISVLPGERVTDIEVIVGNGP